VSTLDEAIGFAEGSVVFLRSVAELGVGQARQLTVRELRPHTAALGLEPLNPHTNPEMVLQLTRVGVDAWAVGT